MATSPEDRRSRALANDDFNDIQELQKNQAFNRYWMRRVLSKLDDARDKLCRGVAATDAVALQMSRIRLDIWEEVFKILGEDERACRSLLADAEAKRD